MSRVEPAGHATYRARMSVQTLSYHAFLLEMEWLFELLNAHVERVGWRVASHQLRLPRLPRRVGNDMVPFYLAADLRSLFEFARGARDVSQDFIEDTIATVVELLFAAPIDSLERKTRRQRNPPDWSVLAERPLGTILLAARGRARVMAGQWPALDEVQALTGMSRGRLERTGVKLEKRDKKTVCEPTAVARLLARVDKDDDDNL